MDKRTTVTASNLTRVQREFADLLKEHWRLYTLQGVGMISLGAVAIAVSVSATSAVDLYLGWLFLLSGLLTLVIMASTWDVPGFWWALVTGVLSIVLGVGLVLTPAEGVASLTALLIAFFVLEGVFQAVASVSYREAIGSSWGWLLASGLADLLLVAVIICGWPGTDAWALGLLAGMCLFTSGSAIAMVSLSARSLARTVSSTIEER